MDHHSHGPPRGHWNALLQGLVRKLLLTGQEWVGCVGSRYLSPWMPSFEGSWTQAWLSKMLKNNVEVSEQEMADAVH